MLRLSVLLLICIYAAYVILPEALEPADVSEAETGRAAPPPGPVRTTQAAVPDEIVVETGESWHVDRVIRPLQPERETEAAAVPVPEPVDAATSDEPEAAEEAGTPPPPAPAADPAPVQAPADGATILYVTGDRVNLRAGPSTETDIVTALTFGTPTEMLETAPDGWFRIRDTASGLEGFMSGDFLSPTAP
ncbi:SH3 domain-containing protein [Rhodobacterales bacterium HKCCE2091]|nr:SH3 domain-containing protein [Rhodobacterales bacterium HKCCE2091]